MKMWTNLLHSVLLAAALCLNASAHPVYQTYIPNGDRVPNPCNLSTIWPGVGHQNVYGGGDRNPFGLDFAANNHTWNQTLCMKDSDGDGKTNGQELGDPNCNWTMGSTPMFSTNLSHPGVCQPVGSPLCSEKNIWLLNCNPRKLDCPAINESGVRNYTLRFPVTPIPTKETTYICYQFNLPNDSVSDIIAIEPVIDNALVLHHMLLYACSVQPMDGPANETFKCGMGGGMFCRSLIGIWGVGVAGQCLNSQLGFRIGSDGFQYAILQLHWNNPQLSSNMTDSSGMRIYYTTQLRPNRGQVAIVGQTHLEIPPGQPDVTFTGNCSYLCTRHLPYSIFITSAILHMHTLGKSGDVRLIRNGELVQTLENVTQFDYNSPRLLEYETPIEVKPGDEIQVKCVYDSTKMNTTTVYGEATSDEMCYGFFAYYPLIENIGFCGQWKTINICSDNYDYTEFGPCDYNTFRKLVAMVRDACTGAENCTTTPCAVVIHGILDTGCQNYPDVRAYTYNPIFERCMMEMPSSTAKPPVSSTQQSTDAFSQSTQQSSPSDSSGRSASSYVCFIIILMVYAFRE